MEIGWAEVAIMSTRFSRRKPANWVGALALAEALGMPLKAWERMLQLMATILFWI